ncbi:MAG TPA: hypothetical protein VFB62_21205, partial [Polyangiaceae bacterium]|nr:hypothetical protein [Polyangiaceae bacterium]
MFRLWLCALLVCVACAPQRPPRGAEGEAREMRAALVKAIEAEATDPLAAKPYLDAIDAALNDDRASLQVVLAALDALVWREVPSMAPGVEHALVHRSPNVMADVSARLRGSWSRASAAPIQRAAIAMALHELALRVGADGDAIRWRRRSGCAPEAAVFGPVGWPPLGALEKPSPIDWRAPLPRSLPGIAPFANQAPIEKVYADACTIDVTETSAQRGLRLVVIDIDNPREQTLQIAVHASAAARVSLGGRELVERPFWYGAKPSSMFARARAEAGKLRLIARVGYNQDGRWIAVQVTDSEGQPLTMRAPRPGTTAQARVSSVEVVDVGAGDLTLATAALLGTGQVRRAAGMFEHSAAPAPASSPVHWDLLRLRALDEAEAIPRNQLLVELESASTRLAARCKRCWEARIVKAAIARERHGQGTGTYKLLEAMGVRSDGVDWAEELQPTELAFVALDAKNAGLTDVARVAFDALERRVPRSAIVADVDWALHRRSGADEVAAACGGGTHRAGPRCMQAHIARSDLKSTLAEMERLRRLRGSPSIHRETEMAELLGHGRTADAMRIYEAMPPARRALALLGALDDKRTARARFVRDRLRAADAPWSYQPLASLLGVARDRAPQLESEGAELVARDRSKPFLPGAATAVLRRLETYDLEASGLLHYWIYDLRRVSGTSDVAGGTWSGTPIIEGRRGERLVRQRIHKKDGRVLDPDPRAEGAQQDTQLSQLESGDYVEAITEGWALPDDDGQLVVDTPDLLPLRTSVREGVVRWSRPTSLEMPAWAHPLLGRGSSRKDRGRITREWRLDNQAPRRIEEGVPPLEARVGISFGTRRWEHLAHALGDRFRSLDDGDPYMKKWVREVAGGKKLSHDQRVAKVVAAAGKAIARAEGFALSDEVASMGGGSQRETAHWILEQGTGSRTWVVHRALRELGVKSEVAVAETTPFSASPGFPPHAGRFTHPLVRAQLDGGKVVWIDADVDGPPLPPGRVSPELRGRKALVASGEMVTVDAQAAEDVDEVDLRLTVDDRGDASGTFTALLHGRAAQGLAQMFETVVGSEREQMLRSVVLGWVPWADVRKITLSSDASSWRLSLRADIGIAGFARPEGRDGKKWL